MPREYVSPQKCQPQDVVDPQNGKLKTLPVEVDIFVHELDERNLIISSQKCQLLQGGYKVYDFVGQHFCGLIFSHGIENGVSIHIRIVV